MKHQTLSPDLPSARNIEWLKRLAHTTAKTGQYQIAARFAEIAAALEDAERLNTITFRECAVTDKERRQLQ